MSDANENRKDKYPGYVIKTFFVSRKRVKNNLHPILLENASKCHKVLKTLHFWPNFSYICLNGSFLSISHCFSRTGKLKAFDELYSF